MGVPKGTVATYEEMKAFTKTLGDWVATWTSVPREHLIGSSLAQPHILESLPKTYTSFSQASADDAGQ